MKRLAVLAALVLGLLSLGTAEAHINISPRDQADVNNNNTVDVLDLRLTAACIEVNCGNTAVYDQNHDGSINVIDLNLVASCAGSVSSLPCGNGYSNRDMLFDSTGDHDACIPVPTIMDWLYHARFGDPTPDASNTLTTGWGVVQWKCGVTPHSGVTFEIRNPVLYARVNGQWDDIATTATWCKSSNVASNEAYDEIGCTMPMPMPTTHYGPSQCETTEWMKQHLADQYEFQCAIHWATPQVGFPSGTECLAMVVEMKSNTANELVANVGSDWWNSPSGYEGDTIVGRYRNVLTDWATVASSSCPTSIIQNSPPPLP